MASEEERANLATAAARLNAATPHLPALILMTDETRLRDPLAAARALPSESAVIVRHTQDQARRELAMALLPAARARRLRLLIANDPTLAEDIDADGLHLSEARATDARDARASHPDWFITAAAHSERAVAAAAEAGADAALVSPVFPTPSHPDRLALGVEHFLSIARASPIPVYALGGVNATNAALLMGTNVAGIAAIGALIP